MNREDNESKYIAAALHNNDVLGMMDLAPEMFTTYRPVFERLVKLSSVGQVQITDLMSGATAKTKELLANIDPWTSANWEFYANAIRQAWKDEVIKQACSVAAQQTADDAIQTLETAFDVVSQREVGSRTKTLGETLLPALQRIKDGKDSTGILFGFQTIDRCTLGARPSQFIVIGGRPSQGKSALMQQIVRHMARTLMVGVISIESDDEELTIRMIASESSTDSRLIISGSLSPAALAEVTRGAHRLADVHDRVLIHDQGDLNFNTLKTIARRMVKRGCRALFIDYLQLIEYSGSKNKFEEVGTVSRKLKALAKSLKIPIVALAQLGRDADEKRPTLADFQYSSAIEQDADQAWLIWHPKDKDNNPLESRIIIAKARDGMTRDVRVKFDRPTLTFYEIEEGAP